MTDIFSGCTRLIAPLDWSGGAFLAVYAGLVVGVLLFLWLLRWRGGPSRTRDTGPLSLLELAYLGGGPQRVVHTVMLCFLTAEAERDRRRLPVSVDALSLPEAAEPFRACLAEVATRWGFRAAINRRMAVVRDPLVRRGLAVRQWQIRLVQAVSAVLLAAVLLLGLARMGIGVLHDRPIGFLSTLVLVTALAGYELMRHPLYATRAGKAVFRRWHKTKAEAARQPQNNTTAWAFALKGASALSRTVYTEVTGVPAP